MTDTQRGDDRNQPTDTAAPDTDWAGALLVGVAVAVLLPVAVGWRFGAQLLAEQPHTWRRQRWRLPVLGLLALAAPVAAWLVVTAADIAVLPLGWGAVVVLLIGWVALAPLGLLVALLRLPGVATALSEGRADPRVADRIRRAIWRAGQTDAATTARHITADQGTAATLLDDAVGVVISEDRRDSATRLRDRRDRDRDPSPWIRPAPDGDRLVLPEHTPPRAVVLGVSGSGKTTALRAMVCAALASRRWRVCVIDAKGSARDAATLLDDAARLGAAAVHWSSAPFDGWRGDLNACVRKAACLLPPDSPAYYRQRAETALYAVGATGTWTSTTDLFNRLSHPRRWVADPDILAELLHRADGQPVHRAIAADIRAALRGLGSSVDGRHHPGGWCWDEDAGAPWDLAVVSVTSGANPAALGAAALILTDLDTYRLERRDGDTRGLLVIVDEAAAMLNGLTGVVPDLGLLMDQVRSQNIGLVIAAQSPHGLGIQGDRLLASGAQLLVGRLPDPDPIVRLAGTVRTVEMAHQGEASGGRLTGATAAREQVAMRLDPDRLRDAETGVFAFVEGTQPVRWVAIRPP